MAITLNHSVPFGAYGGAMAQAAAQEHYGALMNPYIRQFFEQEYQSGEQTRNRDWRTGERMGSQTFSAEQAALDRALRERESALSREFAKWQTQYTNPQASTLRFVGGYSGPGSFASEQQRIRSKYFG